MRLCNLLGYGIFDTDYIYPGKKETSRRVAYSFELEFFLHCTGEAIVDDRHYRLTPGSLLCVKPGQQRRSIFGFQCYYLHMTFDEDSPYRDLLTQAPDYFQLIDHEKYARIFEELIRHLFANGYDEESDYVNAKLLELFYRIRKDSENNRKYLALAPRRENEYIPRVLVYLQENFRHDVKLADMAYVTGYSPNYFHHVFTSVMGKSPQQYLLELRIRQAKLLLTQSTLSLSEIAYECGFSSQSYFNLQFRRETHTTPGKYRKQNIERYLP